MASPIRVGNHYIVVAEVPDEEDWFLSYSYGEHGIHCMCSHHPYDKLRLTSYIGFISMGDSTKIINMSDNLSDLTSAMDEVAGYLRSVGVYE